MSAHLDAGELGGVAGRTPSLEGQVVGPVEVLPVSTRLDDVVGRDVAVLSVERYPTWFFVHLGGRGHLSDTAHRLRRAWTASDDCSGHYRGTVRSTHSGYPWTIDAPFTPALHPAATSLTLRFPNPFGPGTIQTSPLRLRSATIS